MGKKQPASPAPEPAAPAPEPAAPASEPAAPAAPAAQQVPEASRSPEAPSDEAAFQEADLQSEELHKAAKTRAQQLLEKSKAIFGARIGAEESRNLAEETGMRAKLAEDSDYNPDKIVDTGKGLNKLEQELTGEKLQFRAEDIRSETVETNGGSVTAKTTPAYVMTHDERGTVLGRLRVRNPETGKVEGRVDPGMRVTIVTSAPVRKFTSKSEGEVLFVKIKYTDAKGAEKEGYAALKYLVSPYDHAGATEAEAPAPAAESEQAPAQPAPSPRPAADAALPIPAERPSDEPEGDTKPSDKLETTETLSPSEQEKAPENIKPGDVVKILRYGPEGEYGKYLGTIGENIFVELSRRGVSSIEMFRYGEVIAPGKRIPQGTQEIKSDIEGNLAPFQAYRDFVVPENVRLTFISYADRREIKLNPGVKLRLSNAYQDARMQRYPTFRERLAYIGDIPGAVLVQRNNDNFGAVTRVPPIEQSENYDRIPKGKDMADILEGKIPSLEWKNDQFRRLKKDFSEFGLRQHELVYALNPLGDPVTIVRANGEIVSDISKNDMREIDMNESKFLTEYKKNRILSFLRQMDFAGFTVVAELEGKRVSKVTETIKDSEGSVLIKKGEYVAELESIGTGFVTVETSAGKRHKIATNLLQRAGGVWEKLGFTESFELGQIQYVIDRFRNAQAKRNLLQTAS